MLLYFFNILYYVILSYLTNQYFTTHDRSPHHLAMFWSWFGQASELAGDAASSGTNSRSGGLEPEQPGRPRFFIFSKLAHEQLGGRHVSEASTTHRGESSERICMSKMMKKTSGKFERWRFELKTDRQRWRENGWEWQTPCPRWIHKCIYVDPDMDWYAYGQYPTFWFRALLYLLGNNRNKVWF